MLITTLIMATLFDEQLAKLPVMSEQLNINSFVSSYRSGYRPLHHLERVLVVCQNILPSSRPCHPYRALWLPGYFTLQSAKSSISRSLVETRQNVPILKITWLMKQESPLCSNTLVALDTPGQENNDQCVCYFTFLVLIVYLHNLTKFDYFH